jgi:phosphohistidine phosphatase SixA
VAPSTDSDKRTVYLVRHAVAVPRGSWTGPDVKRPLRDAGLRQAEALAERSVSSGRRLERVLSSPAVRCRQTVEPTAARAGLVVEERDGLMEGSDPLDALDLLLDEATRTSEGSAIVACSHGDVIDGILESFGPLGVVVDGPLQAPKGATWELEISDGLLESARFVAPPRS